MSALVRTIRKAILGTAANRNQVLKESLEALGIEAGQSDPTAMLKLQQIILNSGRDSEVLLRRAFNGLNLTGGGVGGGEVTRICNALLRSGRESELRAAIDDLIELEAEEYIADAVSFVEGAQLVSGGALTGASGEYTKFIFSAWFKFPDTSLHQLARSNSGQFDAQFSYQPDNKFFGIAAYDSDQNGDLVFVDDVPAFGSWVHVVMAYDHENEAGTIAVLDGAADTLTIFANENPPTLEGETSFKVTLGNTGGDVADYYLAFGQWLDLTNPSNLEKFISSGKPVYLGIDGSLPTGSPPTIFFSGDSTEFLTNRGTGGLFTAEGTITNAASSPSN